MLLNSLTGEVLKCPWCKGGEFRRLSEGTSFYGGLMYDCMQCGKMLIEGKMETVVPVVQVKPKRKRIIKRKVKPVKKGGLI